MDDHVRDAHRWLHCKYRKVINKCWQGLLYLDKHFWIENLYSKKDRIINFWAKHETLILKVSFKLKIFLCFFLPGLICGSFSCAWTQINLSGMNDHVRDAHCWLHCKYRKVRYKCWQGLLYIAKHFWIENLYFKKTEILISRQNMNHSIQRLVSSTIFTKVHFLRVLLIGPIS